MAEESRYEQGKRASERLFGKKRAAMGEENLEKMSPAFREFVMENFRIYDRPALELKMRSAITIAVLAALGRSQELVMHVGAGLNVGLTEEQIREIFLQVAVYAGAPAAIQAYRVANERFEEIRQGKD